MGFWGDTWDSGEVRGIPICSEAVRRILLRSDTVRGILCGVLLRSQVVRGILCGILFRSQVVRGVLLPAEAVRGASLDGSSPFPITWCRYYSLRD